MSAEMPKKVEPEKEIGQPNWDYCKGYNQACDDWQAYHLKKMGEDRKFFNHIQSHLQEGQEVICKICGKTAKEIINEV